MTKYPKAVKAQLSRLHLYEVNDNLDRCNIVHLYPSGLAYPDGYVDSRFFELRMYNSENMQMRVYAPCDSLDIADGVGVKMIRIFADGSTLVKFASPVTVVIEGYFGTTAIVCEADE